ncbi:hypothetical protein [Hymenobacter arizonensis]|uniref:hypothetical protein n=1 Tax=Hymenobacter arizonensis TaxID=1227077 RepID=UPI000B80BAAA|nr:hypothetical protein [Hymenobacter arizonensis]
MKALQIITLAMLGLLTMSSSCEKESQNAVAPEPCSPSMVAITAVPGLSASPACLADATLEIRQSSKQIITSAAQFRTAYTCPNPPVIDFGSFTLLTGQTKLPSGGRVISQQITRSCKDYKYTVVVQQGTDAAVTTAKYHALIPRIATDAKVEFEVQILP